MIKKLALALFLILALTACSFFQALPQTISGDGANSTDTEVNPIEEEIKEDDKPAETETVAPVAEANPLDLTFSLEETLAAEAEIGPEGGSLSVEASDGTLFNLVIPEEALFSPELIRMTPADSISGFPSDEATITGVKLEPEGLIFFKPASIEIIPAETVEGMEMVGFGTAPDGEDFYLQPSFDAGDGLILPLLHFSGHGMVQARKDEMARIQELYTPTTAQNNAVDQLGTIISLVDDPQAQLDAITQIMRQWFDHSISVRIRNAAIFDDELDTAVGEFIVWKNMIEDLDLTLGFDGALKENLRDEFYQGLDELATTFKDAFQKASERCISDKEPEEAFKMYRYGLTATYLQLWGRSGLDKDEASDLVEACFQFEFVFRSKTEGSLNGDGKVSQVTSRIPLEIDDMGDLDFTGGLLSEKGDLTFEVNTLENKPDNCEMGSNPGEMSVSVIFKLNYSMYNAWSISEVKILMLFVEDPVELVTCAVQGIDSSTPVLFWRPAFQVVNTGFFNGPFMEMDLPIVNEGEVFAEMELYGPIPDIPNGEETSTYQIIHNP